jgi:hypothetical protein
MKPIKSLTTSIISAISFVAAIFVSMLIGLWIAVWGVESDKPECA